MSIESPSYGYDRLQSAKHGTHSTFYYNSVIFIYHSVEASEKRLTYSNA